MIGDRWTLMILRDAFYGIRRFGDFKRRLGITQAVLSARLTKLVDDELLAKHPLSEDAAREEYKLTPRGRELFPIVLAVMQWGDKSIHGDGGPPVELYNALSGALLDPIDVRAGGLPTNVRDISFRPGSGARAETIAEFERMSALVDS